jgi:hypothetical protein
MLSQQQNIFVRSICQDINLKNKLKITIWIMASDIASEPNKDLDPRITFIRSNQLSIAPLNLEVRIQS